MCYYYIFFLKQKTAYVMRISDWSSDVCSFRSELSNDVMAHVAMQSGEGRFRWLHARPGRLDALREVVEEQLGDDAWIRTRQEAIDEGWYGPVVTDVAAGRLDRKSTRLNSSH